MNLQSSISTEPVWHSQAAAHVANHAGAIIALREPSSERLPVLARKPVAVEARQDVPIDEISFCALKTMQEINSIKYLRGELNLPGSVLADPEFERLEKKETSTAWLALSPVAMH